MIVWINGAFGAGKTTVAHELSRRLPGSVLYDPEEVGFFLRKCSPCFQKQDNFQDIPLWRGINAAILHEIDQNTAGTVVVPMTVYSPQYFAELVTRLRDMGTDVRHVILFANAETLRRRLKKRSAGWFQESFAKQHIAPCIRAFSEDITEGRIDTDNLSVDEVVEMVAHICGLSLSADSRTSIRRIFDRLLVSLRHIR